MKLQTSACNAKKGAREEKLPTLARESSPSTLTSTWIFKNIPDYVCKFTKIASPYPSRAPPALKLTPCSMRVLKISLVLSHVLIDRA